jgi:FMN phosphatase YigB (HAD superfamily)
MSEKPLKPAKLFIWDVDNVIYPYDEAFHKECDRAAARAAISLGAADGRSYDELVALAAEPYRKHGTSFHGFSREMGIPMEAMHKRYHEEVSTEFMKPDQRLIEGFRKVAVVTPGVTHVILTHGSTDWAKRVLAARGLSQFFKPEHIIGTEQLGFTQKCDGVEAFAHVLARTGHAAEDAIMIEDTAKNLRFPQAMGMQTAFISYGKGDGDGYASHVFNTAQDFLQAYQKQIMPPAPTRSVA